MCVCVCVCVYQSNIRGFDWYLVIPRLQVHLVEIFLPLELVQKVINLWDRVPIPDSDLIQCSIVNAVSKSHPSATPT
jgi:hypothetical protein